MSIFTAIIMMRMCTLYWPIHSIRSLWHKLTETTVRG